MNTSLKLILVSLSTALSFVLIMGVETVFSENPTALPPSTGLSPVFTNVQITDGTDSISVSPSEISFGKTLTDKLGFTKDGLVRTYTPSGGSHFVLPITTPVLNFVNGILTLGGAVEMSEAKIYNNLQVDGAVNTLKIQTNTIESIGASDTKIDSTGGYNLKLNSVSLNPVVIGKDLTVNGNIIANTNTSNFLDINARNLTLSAGLTVNAGNANMLGGLTVGSSISGGSRNLNVNGDAIIKGVVKATSFGKYDKYGPNFVTASSIDQQVDISYTCPVDSYPVYCGWYVHSSYRTRPWNIDTNYIDMNTRTCMVKATNKYSGDNYIRSYTTCFTPGG